MGTEIVPYGRRNRLPKAVSRQMEAVRVEALMQAGRVSGIELVTRTSMQAAANLSNLEGMLIASTPLAEPRLKMLADTAILAMASEIAAVRGFG